jgi:lysophospholipase L1-like esterase
MQRVEAQPGRARPNSGTWAVRLSLILVSLLLPLVLLEILFRVAGPFLPGNYDTGVWLVRHPVYGHYHPPDHGIWIQRDEFTTYVQTNAAGQRGRSILLAKPPGTFRIMVLGDSFVEAVQVAEQDRFVRRLEAQLNADGGPVRYEVVDGGCGGWGTGQELLYLQQEGLAYQPDLVLLAFFVGNDVGDNSIKLQLDGNRDAALKPYFSQRADGSLELLTPSPPPETAYERVANVLRLHSTVYNFLESGVLQKLGRDDLLFAWRTVDALQPPSYQGNQVYGTRLTPDWKDGWAITERLLRLVHDETSAHGIPFGMMIVPTRAQVSDQAWRGIAGGDGGRRAGLDRMFPNAQLQQIAGRIGAPLLDLVPALRAADQAGLGPLYYERDQHWTAAGHAVAAKAIVQFVREQWAVEGGR